MTLCSRSPPYRRETNVVTVWPKKKVKEEMKERNKSRRKKTCLVRLKQLKQKNCIVLDELSFESKIEMLISSITLTLNTGNKNLGTYIHKLWWEISNNNTPNGETD